MALKIAPTTHRTCSGVFLRMDEGFGLLAHSPYTGLTYAIDPLDADGISQWLNNNSSEPPADHYKYSLGAGWAVPLEKSRQHVPQLLPDRGAWPMLPTPHQPILINWLITGRCPFACRYCYAEDLMRNEALEPKSVDIERIVESILSLNPLVVVVTGGDPLFSGHLAEAIHLLSGRWALSSIPAATRSHQSTWNYSSSITCLSASPWTPNDPRSIRRNGLSIQAIPNWRNMASYCRCSVTPLPMPRSGPVRDRANGGDEEKCQ